MKPIERLQEMMERAESFRPTMMDEELVILNALPALLACAKALQDIVDLSERCASGDSEYAQGYMDGGKVIVDIARAALSALAQAQEQVK